VLIVGKGKAPVTDRVLVTALEVLAGIAQQERSGEHQLASGARAVLKTSLHYDANAHFGMLLFKRAIAWTGVADHICNTPSLASRQTLPRGMRRSPTAEPFAEFGS
jgi:hypothetical protein